MKTLVALLLILGAAITAVRATNREGAPPTTRALAPSCDPNKPDACESEFCTDNVCCDSSSCVDPERCDIFGQRGTCHSPLFEGEPCDKHSDCEDPLRCLFDSVSNQYVCAVPPQPTPTLIPYTPAPTPCGPIVCVCYRCGPGQCHDRQLGGCYPCLPPTACSGDCNGDGAVTVDEILTMVNIALLDLAPECVRCGVPVVGTCPAGDIVKDCRISIDEIVWAVNSALAECPGVQRCGGISGDACPSKEYCELPERMCGAADQQGECRPRPVCDDTVAPVCGCNGLTYGNDCERALAGVARDHVGPCA